MSSSPVSSSNTSQNLDEKIQDEPDEIGFWHPDLVPKRKTLFRKWLTMTLFLGCAVLALLSLYWGSLFHLFSKYSTLTVLVVDFDGQMAPYLDTDPIFGPFVVQTLKEHSVKPGPHLGYRFMSPSDFNNDPLEVRRNIYHQHNWVAMIVNANATALLREALEKGNKTYDPMGAGQVIFVEARQEAILDEYILPEVQMMRDEIAATFGSKWISEVAKNLSDSSIRKNIEMAPQVLNPAIGFTEYNLRPFDIPVATPSTSVGLIYLVIFSFFAFPFFMPIHGSLLAPGSHRPLKFANFIIWRILASITTFGFLSLCYSLVSLAYGVPFSRPSGSETEVSHASAFGRGSFVVYWMLNWVGMTSFGLPSENMCMLLGPPWFSLWLIFWVICNVCVSFYFVPLSPGFYKYGYAWPMHNIVEASRTIIFDVHSRIGLNFGVLFAWCAVSILLFPLCATVARWRMMREKKREAEIKKKTSQANDSEK